MCLISIAGKGTEKYSEFLVNGLRTSYEKNNDGIGFAYKYHNDGRVYIHKGFKSIDEMLLALKAAELSLDDELVIHLRTGNKGAKSVDMMHPFVVSEFNDEILLNNQFVEKSVLCHNGTFYDFSVTNSVYSDTYFFVENMMSVPEILALLKRDKAKFLAAFGDSIIRSNKLCLLHPDADMTIVGDYKQEQGYYFSNDSYKTGIRNVGGQNINWGEDITTHRPRQTTPADAEQLALELNSLTNSKKKKGDRFRDVDGKLTANGEFDITIPPQASMNFIRDKYTGNVLYNMGFAYIPNRYLNNQYMESKFIPMEFNYDHFLYQCRVKDDITSVGTVMVMTSYDIGHDENQDQLHTLRMYDEKTNSVCTWDFQYYTTKELLESFDIIPKAQYRVRYLELFHFFRKFNATKTVLKKLDITLGRPGKNTDKIFFRGTEGYKLSFKLYANYGTKMVYGKEAKTQGLYITIDDSTYSRESEPPVYVD